MFFRLYQHTGIVDFQQRSQYWLNCLLTNPAFQESGYLFPYNDNGKAHWKPDVSLLNGSAGVILTLLSQLEPSYTQWDRIFMTSFE